MHYHHGLGHDRYDHEEVVLGCLNSDPISV